LLWIFVLSGTLLCSLLLTWCYRRYALEKSLMDIPNDRSSHLIPTPRGGGISIVFTCLITISLLREHLNISLTDYGAFILPGVLLAIISYIDDRKQVSPIWRFFFQVVVAFLVVALLGGVEVIYILSYKIDYPWVLSFIAVIGLVWLINLYNFMDGIDGIAALTAVVVSISLLILLWLVGSSSFILKVLLIFIASTLGFLWFNFPKASIFMGDIGSCFLGLILGIFIIKTGQENPDFYWALFILLGTFILDATITLIRRALRGQKIYMAHREHAYQHLSRRWGSHPKVTLIYALITLVGLLPVSILVVKNYLDGFVALLLAYIPLGVWIWRTGAGVAQVLEAPAREK
jgi:Fuc2NAc and GlcNAc transferase